VPLVIEILAKEHRGHFYWTPCRRRQQSEAQCLCDCLSILTLLTLHGINYTVLLIVLRLPVPVISDLKFIINLRWQMENSACKPLLYVLTDR